MSSFMGPPQIIQSNLICLGADSLQNMVAGIKCRDGVTPPLWLVNPMIPEGKPNVRQGYIVGAGFLRKLVMIGVVCKPARTLPVNHGVNMAS